MSEDTRDDIEPVGEEVTYEQEYTDEISPIPVQEPVKGEDDTDYAEPEGDESAEEEVDENDDEGFDED